MDISLGGSSLTRNWSDEELRGLSIELSAFDGQISTSTIPVPDPTGADEVPPGRSVRVDEGTTRLLDGIIVQEGRSRGFEPTNPNKKDDYTVEDPNTFLYGFRVLADRPEETDYARIQWFFDTYLPAVATTQVLNTSTTTMVAASYQSDGVADIMRDAIDITGKTLFLHDLADGSGICAHWHALTAGHTCGLTIDDTDPTVNGPTSWLPQNPSRVRDGHDLTNDYSAYGADGIGPVTVSDGTSIGAYDVDGKSHQAFANFPAATDIATLTADAQRLLETNKDPRDTWTCTIGPLDETALALIRVGDIITCTSTVMTLSASPQRIASLRLSVAGGQRVAPTLWMAELTLGAPVRGPGGRSSARPPETQLPLPSVPFVLDNDNSWWQFWGGWDPTAGAYPDFASDPGADCVGHVYTATMETVSLTSLGSGVFAEPGCVLIGREVRLGVSRTTDPDDPDIELLTDRLFLKIPSGYSGLLHLVGYKITHTNVAPPAPVIRIRPFSWSGTPAEELDLGLGLSYPMTVGGSSTPEGSYYYWPISVSLPVASGAQYALDSLDMAYIDGPFFVGVNTAAMDDENENPVIGHQTTFISAGPSDGVTTDYDTLSPYRPGTLEVYVGGLPWTTDGYVETPGGWTFTQVPFEGDNPEDNLIEYRYVTA